MSSSQPSLQLLLRSCIESVQKGQLPPHTLLMLLLSKVLGFAIIAGGAVVKLPQISTILKSRSAAGLANLSFELENIGYIIHSAYGYLLGMPINAYGEATVMLLQNTVLLALVYKFARTSWLRSLSIAAVNIALVANVLLGRVSIPAIRTAYDLNNVIFTAARLPQIWKNYQAKSTGQLSIVTYLANSFGCIARIFTSYHEGGGMTMIRGFVLGLALNLITAGQILYYKNSARTSAKKKN